LNGEKAEVDRLVALVDIKVSQEKAKACLESAKVVSDKRNKEVIKEILSGSHQLSELVKPAPKSEYSLSNNSVSNHNQENHS